MEKKKMTSKASLISTGVAAAALGWCGGHLSRNVTAAAAIPTQVPAIITIVASPEMKVTYENLLVVEGCPEIKKRFGAKSSCSIELFKERGVKSRWIKTKHKDGSETEELHHKAGIVKKGTFKETQ